VCDALAGWVALLRSRELVVTLPFLNWSWMGERRFGPWPYRLKKSVDELVCTSVVSCLGRRLGCLG
jgi:hypothetical protein